VVDGLVEQVTQGIADATPEHPDLNEDDIAWEILHSVCQGHSQSVYNEVRNRCGF